MLNSFKTVKKFKLLLKILSVLMLFVLIFTSVSPVQSGLEEERKKLAQYQAQLEQIRKNIVSIEKSQKELLNLVDNLNAEIDNLEKEIALTKGEIARLDNEIKQKENEISLKEKEIALRQSELSSALTLSYQLSFISPVELLYEGNDPEAVSKRITYISYISSYTDKLMKTAENDKKELEQYKKQLSDTKLQYQNVLKQKQDQEEILNEELDMKNRLLQSLKEKKTYLLYKQSELEEEIQREEEIIKKIIEEMSKGGNYAGSFIWPVKGTITSGFGMRFHPILHVWRLHDGIDIAVPTGTPVKASADGIVIYTGWKEGYGNAVIISHGSNYSTLYAHLLKYIVKENQVVKQGEIIGYVDSTGWSTGPHLHFSIYKKDPETGKAVAIDPKTLLP